MSHWKEYKLGKAPLEIIDGDRGKMYPKQDEFYDNGYCLFLSTKNVRESGFDFSECSFISKEKDAQLRKGKLKRNDLVLTTRGTIGNIALFNESIKYSNIRINSGMVIIRPRTNELNSNFCFYVFRNLQNHFKNFVSGSAQPQLPIRDLSLMSIFLPPLPTQTAIASILSSLDEKIELNNAINRNLEALAQALFKQWFVEFNFPVDQYGNFSALSGEMSEGQRGYKDSGGEMLESEFGMIPKGWRVGNYGDIAIQKQIKVRRFKEKVYKVYSAIKTSELVFSEDFFNKQVFSKSIDNYYVVDNLWFAYNPSRINIGSIGLNKGDIGAVSPAYVVFGLKDNLHFFVENHLKLEKTRNEIVQKCSGTVRQALTFESLSTIKLVIPSIEVINKFNDFWIINTNAINIIQQENQYLSTLRDTLLPKLISGELEVDEALTQTEKAV